ncbi:MAG TPA: alpha/beta hydrolase-fold protein [Fimbriiglobus sp.]
MHYFPDFGSEFLPHRRPVVVWTPPGYERNSHRYPVFYLQDGQNLFDPATAFGGNPWRCDETAERVIHEGSARPMILVGVGNSPDRLQEYGPRREGPETNLAKPYGQFLTEELKPFVDDNFRILPGPENTAVGGSSMGGLIALQLCRWYPDVFGLCGAISPSLWWDHQAFLKAMKWRTRWIERTRVWLDMGGREGSTPAAREGNLLRARKLAIVFAKLGKRVGDDFQYLEVPDGEHNERDWGARFDQVLRFLFRPGWVV